MNPKPAHRPVRAGLLAGLCQGTQRAWSQHCPSGKSDRSFSTISTYPTGPPGIGCYSQQPSHQPHSYYSAMGSKQRFIRRAMGTPKEAVTRSTRGVAVREGFLEEAAFELRWRDLWEFARMRKEFQAGRKMQATAW